MVRLTPGHSVENFVLVIRAITVDGLRWGIFAHAFLYLIRKWGKLAKKYPFKELFTFHCSWHHMESNCRFFDHATTYRGKRRGGLSRIMSVFS